MVYKIFPTLVLDNLYIVNSCLNKTWLRYKKARQEQISSLEQLLWLLLQIELLEVEVEDEEGEKKKESEE